MQIQLDEFDAYEINENGDVFVIESGEMKYRSINENGVVNVVLYNGGRPYCRAVAPLVAKAFRLERESSIYDTIIHLDGDKNNCHVSNIAWRTRQFAVAYHRQLKLPAKTMPGYVVYCKLTDEKFQNTRDAAVKYGLLEADILDSMDTQDGSRTAGLIFEYMRR